MTLIHNNSISSYFCYRGENQLASSESLAQVTAVNEKRNTYPSCTDSATSSHQIIPGCLSPEKSFSKYVLEDLHQLVSFQSNKPPGQIWQDYSHVSSQLSRTTSNTSVSTIVLVILSTLVTAMATILVLTVKICISLTIVKIKQK